MAIEGQTFVLVASQVLTEENLEKNNLVGNHVTKTVSDAVCTGVLFPVLIVS